MWIAARKSAPSSRPGAAWAVKKPRASIQTLPGPLIMISDTSTSSSKGSRPAKGFQVFKPAGDIAHS